MVTVEPESMRFSESPMYYTLWLKHISLPLLKKKNPPHHVSLKFTLTCMCTSFAKKKKKGYCTNALGNSIYRTINKTPNTSKLLV